MKNETFTFHWKSEEIEEMARRKAGMLNWHLADLIRESIKFYPAEKIKRMLDGED